MPASYQALGLSASDEQLLSSPYLTRQLIAYIGNKRKLLPLLLRIFRRIEERGRIERFLDPFSGSGAVARLARALGYRVHAGDNEEYGRVLASAYLTISPGEAERLFRDRGGLSALLEELNALSGAPRDAYIASHYAPADTASADYRRERLFYTRENALYLDRVRERIEELYPEEDVAAVPARRRAKDLLLALLIYEAATHVNTSGVFKACHKGFGGHGGDALRRITEAMELEYPVLSEGAAECTADRADVLETLRRYSAEICYLDPPYNSHQYGSNYHLLNTLALWDKPRVSSERDTTGRLREKAGIRPDWRATRSPFCSRRSAPAALREVLEAADARWIVLSYNSEGIIPFAELYELLAAYGAVEIETRDYTVYRGGRQSISRKTHNQEFQLLLTRGSETPPGERQRFTRFLREQRLLTLLQEPYVPARLTAEFSGRDGAHARLRLFPRDEQARWETDRFHRFTGRFSREDLAPYSLEELEECARRLERAVCADRREEFTVLYRFLSAPLRDAAPERAPGGLDAGRGGAAPLRRDERRIMEVLRKFAHRKYAEQFHADCEKLRTLLRAHPGRLPLIEEQLPVLKELARRRFRG